jgi:hypothetical protein
MNDVFLAVLGSYLVVAMLGFALGQLNAQLQFRRDRELDSWPALPEIDWPGAIGTPYDWDREGTLP